MPPGELGTTPAPSSLSAGIFGSLIVSSTSPISLLSKPEAVELGTAPTHEGTPPFSGGTTLTLFCPHGAAGRSWYLSICVIDPAALSFILTFSSFCLLVPSQSVFYPSCLKCVGRSFFSVVRVLLTKYKVLLWTQKNPKRFISVQSPLLNIAPSL